MGLDGKSRMHVMAGYAPMKIRDLSCMFGVTPLLLLLGCSGSQEVDFDEAIQMGPYTFEVQKAYLRPPDGGNPRLVVHFGLLADESVPGVSFDDLMDNDVDADGVKISQPFSNPCATESSYGVRKWMGNLHAAVVVSLVTVVKENEKRFEAYAVSTSRNLTHNGGDDETRTRDLLRDTQMF